MRLLAERPADVQKEILDSDFIDIDAIPDLAADFDVEVHGDLANTDASYLHHPQHLHLILR